MKRTHSYTSISLYLKCPRLWEWRYVHGQRDAPHPAAQRGNDIHAMLEQFFLGGVYPAADTVLRPWQPMMEKLRETYAPTPELEVAVDENWESTPYDDPNAVMKGKMDLSFTDNEAGRKVRHILDWKTGKAYPDHDKQGKAYVALDTTDPFDYYVRFVYLDQPGNIQSWEYKPDQRRIEVAVLKSIIKRIDNDFDYDPTPSHQACRYCPLSFRNGGNCRRAV